MGDEQDGGVDPVFQVAQQVQHLGLDGHVQGGGGLIGDDQPGVAGQGHGDDDALAHPAGQLMGVHPVDPLAVGDAHQFQQLDGALLHILPVLALPVVQGDHLVHLVPDPKDRIQAGHRLLEDHGHHVAPDALHPLVGHLDHVIGLVPQVQADLPLHHLALGPLKQLHQGQAGHRFAAARLPHYPHGLANGDVKGHTVHTLDGARVGEKIGVQIVKLHGVVGVAHLGRLRRFSKALVIRRFSREMRRDSLAER